VTRVAAFVAAAVAAAAAAVVVVLVVARSPPPPAIVNRGAAAGDGAVVGVARTRLGRILVDARGHTLYLFLEDRRGRSACAASCARVWPPVIVSGRPRVEKGVTGRKLTTTRRADGRRQLIYNGHPLYTLTADTRPGQIRGQGFLGAWYVVSPAGHQIGGHRGSPPADY
jgi:predicted lipoprotein with Yx(FWY)xxD motif